MIDRSMDGSIVIGKLTERAKRAKLSSLRMVDMTFDISLNARQSISRKITKCTKKGKYLFLETNFYLHYCLFYKKKSFEFA